MKNLIGDTKTKGKNPSQLPGLGLIMGNKETKKGQIDRLRERRLGSNGLGFWIEKL